MLLNFSDEGKKIARLIYRRKLYLYFFAFYHRYVNEMIYQDRFVTVDIKKTKCWSSIKRMEIAGWNEWLEKEKSGVLNQRIIDEDT